MCVREIATKTFNPMAAGQDHGLARARIGRQIESSLDRLGVDAVDLYLAHEFDPDVPVAETVAAFEGLIELKLIKAYGVSNFTAEQLVEMLVSGKPAVVQNSYSLLARGDEDGLVQLCAEFGIAYTPFGPLAGGWLTGKYKRDEPAPEGSRMAMRPGPYEHLRRPETFSCAGPARRDRRTERGRLGDACDRLAARPAGSHGRRGRASPAAAPGACTARPRASAVASGCRRGGRALRVTRARAARRPSSPFARR